MEKKKNVPDPTKTRAGRPVEVVRQKLLSHRRWDPKTVDLLIKAGVLY